MYNDAYVLFWVLGIELRASHPVVCAHSCAHMDEVVVDTGDNLGCCSSVVAHLNF